MCSCCGHSAFTLQTDCCHHNWAEACFSRWLLKPRELWHAYRQAGSEGTGVVWLKWWVMGCLRFSHVTEETQVPLLGMDREFEWDQPHDPIARTVTFVPGEWYWPGEDGTLIYILDPLLVLYKLSKLGAQGQSKQCKQLKQWPFVFILAVCAPAFLRKGKNDCLLIGDWLFLIWFCSFSPLQEKNVNFNFSYSYIPSTKAGFFSSHSYNSCN